jgi:hypothetical protein
MAARLTLGCMLCMCASGRESVFGAGNGRGSAGRGGVERGIHLFSSMFDAHRLHIRHTYHFIQSADMRSGPLVSAATRSEIRH